MVLDDGRVRAVGSYAEVKDELTRVKIPSSESTAGTSAGTDQDQAGKTKKNSQSSMTSSSSSSNLASQLGLNSGARTIRSVKAQSVSQSALRAQTETTGDGVNTKVVTVSDSETMDKKEKNTGTVSPSSADAENRHADTRESKIIVLEERNLGDVEWSAYTYYVKAGGGGFAIGVVVAMIGAQFWTLYR